MEYMNLPVIFLMLMNVRDLFVIFSPVRYINCILIFK